MPHLRSGIVATVLLPALAGCTTWTHPTKHYAQLSYDNAVCEKEALDTVKPNYQAQKYSDGKKTSEYTIDTSEYLRQTVRAACLRRGGWISHVRMPWESGTDSAPPSDPPSVAEAPHSFGRGLAAAH